MAHSMATTLNATSLSAKAQVQTKGLQSTAFARGAAPTTRPTSAPVVLATSAKSESLEVSRRAAATVGLAALSAAFLPAQSAQAFLGLGDNRSKDQVYTDDTNAEIEAIKATIELARDDPSRDDAIKSLKTASNSWVAKYRRDNSVSGRPSYGYVYSVVNAVQGHYNNFGTKAPIPRKRMERINKELQDATLALSRGR